MKFRLMREVAGNIGRVIKTLEERYDVDLSKPFANAGLDLEAVGLQELKELGL